ncbi:MAG: S1C family serine protease [Kiritimatiellia bacterium]|jgi:serine protease Do
MSTNFTALSALLNQWATPLVVLALTINVTAERIHPASAVTPYGDADTPMTLFHTGATDAASISEAAELFVPAVAVVRTPRGLGSGFFVNRRGYLITNFHVIRGERHAVVIRFVWDRQIPRRIVHQDVEIVAVDAFHDLAVLRVGKIEADAPITPVVLAPHDRNRPGEAVFVIGNPLGLERSVTQGVISRAARNFNGLLLLQTDAPVNPGNSGGPLFNAQGQVIGIINMQIPTRQGLNFAIPVRHARFLLEHLEDYVFDETNAESGFLYLDPPRRAVNKPQPDHTEEP